MSNLEHLFESNRKWVKKIKKENPKFFSELAKGQDPDILWIGCSDSRVPSNQIMDLSPGDVFVHRNIANLVVEDDIDGLSVIQYAVEILKVKDVIICGHYGCGGVKAAMENKKLGLIDNWLKHIKTAGQFDKNQFSGLSDDEKYDRLCELNVEEQVRHICSTSIIQEAWKNDQQLTVHGWIYSLEDGLLKDLEVSFSSASEFASFEQS